MKNDLLAWPTHPKLTHTLSTQFTTKRCRTNISYVVFPVSICSNWICLQVSYHSTSYWTVTASAKDGGSNNNLTQFRPLTSKCKQTIVDNFKSWNYNYNHGFLNENPCYNQTEDNSWTAIFKCLELNPIESMINIGMQLWLDQIDRFSHYVTKEQNNFQF